MYSCENYWEFGLEHLLREGYGFLHLGKVKAITLSIWESKNLLCISKWLHVKSWFKPATHGSQESDVWYACYLSFSRSPAHFSDQHQSPFSQQESLSQRTAVFHRVISNYNSPRESHLPQVFALWPGSLWSSILTTGFFLPLPWLLLLAWHWI